MQSVAEMVSQQTNQDTESLKLDGLEENDYLLLFNSHAFAGVDPEKHKALQLIGSQIAKKLGGCPLTAKIMGGQLNWHMDEYYWEKILKEDIIDIDQGENGIMTILKLSYNHLPPCLQLCFRFCAIFPENYVFERDELTYMWLNSGLIQNGNEKPENVGRDYFGHLLKRSFFEFKMLHDHCTGSTQMDDHKQVNIFGKQYTEHLLKNSSFYFKDTYYSSASYYVMHDLLRDLARSVSSEECRSIQENNFQYLPKTLRHIYVFTEARNDSLLREILHWQHLRSLVIVFKGNDPQQNHVKMLRDTLNGLKSLRVLSITSAFSCRLPNEIRNLIHLRHLAVRQITADSKLHWFPESVCNLYNLRVLSLLGESEYDNDSEEINVNGLSNLTNLRQLRIPDTIMISVAHIGKLRNLQGSIAFDVRKEIGYTIDELKNIADISLLSIGSLENVRIAKEASMLKLVEKKNLRSLSLFWSRNSSRSSERDEQLIDNLEPCAKLLNLGIQGYNGIRSPCWMSDLSLFNLTSISLIDCIKWEHLPGMGKLPNLKILELNRLLAIKRIDGIFYGTENGVSFPSLKELRFYDMPNWELWMGLNNGLCFPQLDMLSMEKCPMLREFPPLPPITSRLHISDVGLVSLSTLYQVSSFSKDVTSSLSSVLPESIVRLQTRELSLEVLSIKRCNNLMHLPLEEFIKLKSLTSLSIAKCPNLKACVSGTLLPSSLEELCIGNCGELEEPLANSVRNATSLIRLSLEGCAKITSLPSAEVFSRLTELKWLEIKNCKELVSLGGIDALASLDNLEIFGCDKLSMASPSQSLLACDVSHDITVEKSLKVSLLNIDNQSILSTEQLRQVSSVQTVEIVQASASLPEQLFLQSSATLQKILISNANSLLFVPLSIASLNCLQVLMICEASNLELLPDLPISTESAHFCGCHPALEQHYNNSSDLVWNVLKENVEVLQKSCGYEPVFLQDLDFQSEEEEEEEEVEVEGEGEGEGEGDEEDE
jgi:hypothetical protein